MDEYLFITLAKLKADRLRLAREQRAALRPPHPRDEQVSVGHRRSARRPQGWLAEPQWREQS